MEGLAEKLQQALLPLLKQVEALTEAVKESDARIEQIARTKYPETALLQQRSRRPATVRPTGGLPIPRTPARTRSHWALAGNYSIRITAATPRRGAAVPEAAACYPDSERTWLAGPGKSAVDRAPGGLAASSPALLSQHPLSKPRPRPALDNFHSRVPAALPEPEISHAGKAASIAESVDFR
jgi:hypothetical protein